MFARLGAKALILVAAAALIFFGVGLLGIALAAALTALVGAAGAYAVSGAVMLLLALVLMGMLALTRPRRQPPQPPGVFLSLLLGGLAKELPWAAVLSAGLAGATEMFLKRQRNKTRK